MYVKPYHGFGSQSCSRSVCRTVPQFQFCPGLVVALFCHLVDICREEPASERGLTPSWLRLPGSPYTQ